MAESRSATRRTHVNCYLRMRALSILSTVPADVGTPDLGWLFNVKDMEAGRSHAWRPLILTELGRIGAPSEMLDCAIQLCELKPKAHGAVRIVRRWRLGRSTPGSAIDLTQEIANLVDDYRARHPDTTWQQVDASLENVREAVADLEGKRDPDEPSDAL